ncbi:hypothetical protein NECAME_09279 [Necator americanus]|uniref:Uncharacterized protein n=1 Tax=Necator americanus TaxID=51031 RepID=W2TGP0_NECAM|nr:hypothetical protein NECAME_09279 [Necator americanus]ETN80341.1 hypothetical protein NECAME_09279 [Necator americanus]
MQRELCRRNPNYKQMWRMKVMNGKQKKNNIENKEQRGMRSTKNEEMVVEMLYQANNRRTAAKNIVT